MQKKPKIIYIYPKYVSFIKLDIEQLMNFYNVAYHKVSWANKFYIPFLLIYQFIWLCFNFLRVKAIIVSFAGYHSLLPVIFGKILSIPVFIILNGSESVGIESLKYGDLLKLHLKMINKFSFKNCTELWPVSESLIFGINKFYGNEFKYGLKHSFPDLNTPYYIIPNGVNLLEWKNEILQPKEFKPKFITIISGYSQWNRKGMDIFIKCSELFPQFQFSIVGINSNGEKFPANVRFYGRVDHKHLLSIFQEHNIYVQLSRFEGFGCSLIESMSAGLLPLGSNVNFIPKIINNAGWILERDDLNVLQSLINIIAQTSTEDITKLSLLSQNSVRQKFDIKIRVNLMNNRIDKYYGNKICK